MNKRTGLGEGVDLHIGINIMIDFSRAWPHPDDVIIFYLRARSTHTLTNIHTEWVAEKGVFTQSEALGTFGHCHVTYFWMVKLRCLVLGCSQTRWRRNSPGCLPGKNYFVIHFLTNRAWLKNRPASLPPSLPNNIVPQAPIMPPWRQELSEMVLVIISLYFLSPYDLINLKWQFSSAFSKEKSPLRAVRTVPGVSSTSSRTWWCLRFQWKIVTSSPQM